MTTSSFVRKACIAAAAGLGIVVAVPGGGAEAQTALKPVQKLDAKRYVGDWYQIAAMPQFFNLVCARDTRASYTVKKNGDIRVRNSCITWLGRPNTIIGSARVVDRKTGAALKVRFPSTPNQGAADGPANYVVTYLADDYSLAIVGNPGRTSGFVLSRTPAVSQKTWKTVRSTVEKRGFNSCLFLTAPTTGGKQNLQPLCTV